MERTRGRRAFWLWGAFNSPAKPLAMPGQIVEARAECRLSLANPVSRTLHRQPHSACRPGFPEHVFR
jgi:hypothetical protein